MTQRSIGIDLAIRGYHVAQIYDNGRTYGRPIQFRHDHKSLGNLIRRIRDGLEDGDSAQAVMEPTGMSWFPVAHQLIDAGINVARVKGKRVKALRRYLSEHAKTDLADAQVLAAIPGFGGPRLDPVHIPAAHGHALQRLTKQRGRFKDDVSAAKRRLLDLIRWASPGLEQILPDLGTNLSLALLRHGLNPATVLKTRRPTLRKFIARATVELRATLRTVEIFFEGDRIAAHRRASGNGKHTTIADHMPSSHRRHKILRGGQHETAYCLIRECSRASGTCLMRMFPVPHLLAPVASWLPEFRSARAAPKTRVWATSLRHPFRRRCNVRICPGG